MRVHDDAAPALRWVAVLLAIAVLVPIAAATLAVAAVAWVPLMAAAIVAAIAVYWRTRRVHT
jgi:uncharacterized membrane protein (DUF441 family)